MVPVRQYRHRSLAYFTACLTANQLATCLASGRYPALKGLSPVGTVNFLTYIHHSRHTHCIKAIAGEVVKSRSVHLINFCGGGQVIELKSATALILDRYA